MRDWSLIDGVIPGAIMIIGALALVYLVARWPRSWWLVKIPIALVVSAVLVIGGAWLVTNVLQLFPDQLPTEVLVWLGVAVFALLLAILRFPGSGWWSRLGGVIAALLVVVTAASQINAYYAQYPTIGVLIGADKPTLVEFTTVNEKTAQTVSTPPGKTLADVWHAPAGLPSAGVVSSVAIPGTVSGFQARNALVYLPPAYQVSPRPLLPVLVLLPGQPGGPDDWFGPGQLAKALDASSG